MVLSFLVMQSFMIVGIVLTILGLIGALKEYVKTGEAKRHLEGDQAISFLIDNSKTVFINLLQVFVGMILIMIPLYVI